MGSHAQNVALPVQKGSGSGPSRWSATRHASAGHSPGHGLGRRF